MGEASNCRQISGSRQKYADEIANFSEQYLQDRKFTHIYAESGRFDSLEPAVRYSYLPDSREIFDLASITKAIVSTPLIFNTADHGHINLKNSVREWLVDSQTLLHPRLLDLTVADLLSHRSGLPAWRNFWVQRWGSNGFEGSSMHEHIENTLNRFSGEICRSGQAKYSDLGFILLGYILEGRYLASLSEIFSDFKNATIRCGDDSHGWLNFATPAMDRSHAVPTSFCAIRERILVGEVHDENCAALGGIAGHAGLFGTGQAIVAYLRSLMASTIGKKLLAVNSALITPGGDSLLGWQQRSLLPAPKLIIGHLGFTGTAFWVDSLGSSYAVLLTNRVISGRISPWMAFFREQCFRILEMGLSD